MFCASCGSPNPETAVTCSSCGKTLVLNPYQPSVDSGSQMPVSRIPNYLVPSILVTFCCCLPFGIVAIVNASQVDGKLLAGDLDGAERSSRSAKTWCWVSFALGLIFTGGYVACSVIFTLLGVIQKQ